MTGLREDVVYALRQIRRRPGLALVIILSLGGAMGVSTSLFSFVNASWFRPWSVKEPGRMRVVLPAVSVAEWRAWSEEARSFDGLTAIASGPYARLDGRRASIEYVSSSYFDVMGAPIARGRGFSPEDDRVDGPGATAVISHWFWETRLGGDPDILGRSIVLDRAPVSAPRVTFTVVGIAPPGFEGPKTRIHLWLPIAARARFSSGAKPVGAEAEPRVTVAGRLARGTAAPEAQAELATLSRRFRASRGEAAVPILVRSTDRYSQAPPPPQTQALIDALLAGITFITLVACANVANLLLARGHARRGEIAVRLSMGATRPRLVRQLLVEAFVLAFLAGAVGVALATRLPGAIMGALMGSVESAAADTTRFEFPVDHRVLVWALGVSTLSCFAFGLAPALQCTRISVSHALKDAHGLSAPSLKTSLLGYQAIVSVMSLAIAGLMLRSEPLTQARRLAGSLGDLTIVRLEAPAAGVWEQLQALAGGAHVAGATAEPRHAPSRVARSVGIAADYFGLLGVRVVAGRSFQASDPPDHVMVVGEAFARHFWPDADPVGKSLPAGGATPIDADLTGRVVVGVVRDADLTSADPLVAYRPAAASELRIFVVNDPERRVRRQVASLIGRVAPGTEAEVKAASAWIPPGMRISLLAARMTGGFGLGALILAALGFFSLSEYAVRQRTREIGIRTALGARPVHVLRAIFTPAARALLRGLLVGGAGAVIVGVFMRRSDMPAGVNPLDPGTYAAVAVILVVAGIAAAYVPYRRAMAIQPSQALRYE
jgi:hypothetical protein